jgi:DNA repair protein RadD
MYTLRPYQQKIVTSIIGDMVTPGNSIVVAPTGAGKSIIIAEVARQLHKPALILQPSKELLTQNREKLVSYVGKSDIGVFSASMNEKTIKTYTFATIGSIYKKPDLFSHFGIVLLDECDLMNPKKLNTMYSTFFRRARIDKVVGLTATPFRLETWSERHPKGYFIAHTKTVMINRHVNPFWNRIIATIPMRELIDAEYLVPLTYIDKELISQQDIPANTSKTDFNLTWYQRKLKDREMEISTVINFAKKRFNHTLVFCVSIQQAEYLESFIRGAVVTSKTPKKERDKIISDFKEGNIKVVYNVNCLTTGFDHPALDCIICLRPTQSLRLHVQMMGRGVRTFPGKKTCYVIDLAGNHKKMGSVEDMEIVRGESGWDIKTPTGYWHNKELYSYTIKPTS